MQDSNSYLNKKRRFDSMLTIYGRKPVLEALQDKTIPVHRVHLANSNKSAKILDDIIRLANQREVEISYKDKAALSRISKNSKQDQGAAADLSLNNINSLDSFIDSYQAHNKQRFILLDGISNPQNLGMIIRSAAAGGIDGLFIPNKGSASLGALAIKASAGTIFKCPIIRCDNSLDCITQLKANDIKICILKANATQSLTDAMQARPRCYVLGNETEGVSKAIDHLADEAIKIDMHNNVESLNVAITAALIAFMA